MTTLFEFLGPEPIENVITCLNYKIDKVIFFGYHDTIMDRKDSTDQFLKKYCGVKRTAFQPLSSTDLPSTLRTMRSEIEREQGAGSHIFFDLTGGESLILVAFGILSRDYDTPMHLYDIPKGKLIELDEGATLSISTFVPAQHINLSLDRWIELYGGTINERMHKDIKNVDNPEFLQEIAGIWRVASANWKYWNPFSAFLKVHLMTEGQLRVKRSAVEIIRALHESPTSLNTGVLNLMLDALAEEGILKELVHADGKYQFSFCNERIRKCLEEGGSILELYVYLEERSSSDDCRIGVHIDWDGIIHGSGGADVLNEIDVLSLNGYVPTFISCKTGRMDGDQPLNALYELQTVAGRFGGKYARKVLVTAQPMNKTYENRACEMGVEVRNA